jgi:hypothetical protein
MRMLSDGQMRRVMSLCGWCTTVHRAQLTVGWATVLLVLLHNLDVVVSAHVADSAISLWCVLAALDAFLHARLLCAIHSAMPPKPPPPPPPPSPAFEKTRPPSHAALDDLLTRELLPVLERLAHEHGVLVTAVCGVEQSCLSTVLSCMHQDDAIRSLESGLEAARKKPRDASYIHAPED